MAQMNRKRLFELYREFSDYLEQLNSLYIDSLAGYSVLEERLRQHQKEMCALLKDSECGTEAFQDTRSINYSEIAPKDFPSASLSPVMKQGKLKKRVALNGANCLALGRLCVVSAYSYWEEYFRIELGKALGVLPENASRSKESRDILNKWVKSDFWGDMRYLRNSILKHEGVASEETKSCKYLDWFSPGQEIILDYHKMLFIFTTMASFRNWLHSMSLPKSQGLRVPGEASSS
jgi:hypothetical protein